MPSQPHLTNSALAAAYVFTFWTVLRAWPLPTTWQSYALLLLGLVAALAWFANLRRYRAVADTPTAKIASSPLGVVEWSGRGICLPGDVLTAPLSGLPCLWYRFRRERRVGDRYVHEDSGTSFDTIAINDGSATALVDPDGAEVITSRHRSWLDGDYRNIEWLLLKDDTLYALGEHVHIEGAQAGADREALGELLAEWKKDKEWLLRRFDKDGDGELNDTEWEAARQAAMATLRADEAQQQPSQGWPMLRRPRDGRLFIIADRAPRQLARHYALWAWVHLAVLVLAMVAFRVKSGAG